MTHALKAVLFDLDDTLIDWRNFALDWREHEAIHLNYVLAYLSEVGQVPNASAESVCQTFGKNVAEAWARARGSLRAPHLGNIIQETLEEHGICFTESVTLEKCLNAYQWGASEGVTVFDDVPEALETLIQRGVKIGIVTNAFHPMTLRDVELAQFGLLRYFPQAALRISAADVGYLKPHPKIFTHALSVLGCAPEEAVFVGDNIVADVAGAQSVGMRAVLRHMSDTPHLMSEVVRAEATIQHFGQLLAHLDEWYPQWR